MIKTGTLNKMSHEAVKRLLENSKETTERFDMHPYNAPQEPTENQFMIQDQNGVRWIIEKIVYSEVKSGTGAGPRPGHAVRITCLDDSAVAGVIGMQDDGTYMAMLENLGRAGQEALILAVCEKYLSYEEVVPPDRPERHGSGGMSLNPLDILVDKDLVSIGTRELPISYPVFFTRIRIRYLDVQYLVSSGIKDRLAFAGTESPEGRSELVEQATIDAIENSSDYSLSVHEVENYLRQLHSEQTEP